MGFLNVSFCIFATSAFALTPPPEEQEKLHALFHLQTQNIEEALDRYQHYRATTGKHDFDVLQQMGLVLMSHGMQSENPAIVAMTLFGAGLSGSTASLDLLEKGLSCRDPHIQMIALHLIAKIDDDRTCELLHRGMASEFLSTRMEAAYYMAQKKHPQAVGQIEGLMVRLPPMFRPFFPSLFALIGNAEATAALRRLTEDIDPHVRIESILNIARLGRDDFLPNLRKRLTHNHIGELEATAFAIGVLKDSHSSPKLRKLASSPSDNVKIAAILALHELGDRSCIPLLTSLARAQNLFAVAALGLVSGSENTLAELSQSPDLKVRINAATALLLHRDPRSLPGIKELLISDPRDLAFYPMSSAGRTLSIWKAVPSAELRSKDPTLDLSLSAAMREQVLREANHLPEKDFLELISYLFDRQQADLVPLAVSLVEHLRTPAAIQLLKDGASKISFPIVRDYCHLALFRLKEEGPYEEYVRHWIMRQKHTELIRLKPMLPWKLRLESDYTLTPEETSRFLVEALFAIAMNRDIDFLLDAIRQGNPENRYALFGVLMRATE